MSWSIINIGGKISKAPEYKTSGQSGREYVVFSVAVNRIENTKKIENFYVCKAFHPEVEHIKSLDIVVGTRVMVNGDFVLQYANGRTYPTIKINKIEVIQGHSKEIGDYAEDPLKEVKVTDNKFDSMESMDYSVFGDN